MDALALLASGDVEVLGLLPDSSNYTFLAKVRGEGDEILAVYKPTRGERPLWDFPGGTLAAREVASFELSRATGWDIVPPTVLRDTAPMGKGSLQLFVEHDPDRHYFSVMDERAEELRRFAIFDAVANNADRKAGHVIEDARGKLWGVDHGLTFNTEPKLRTVIWAFADESLGKALREELEDLGSLLADDARLGARIAELLTPNESAATLARVETLLLDDRFPAPGPDRPLPWPLI